ncbi:MAG: hypothetical protein QOE58_2521 [Actinomycetota bacterium]|jgi:hypothetical protein|nr:hypothetical protein [Actinomycetota bacterium]
MRRPSTLPRLGVFRLLIAGFAQTSAVGYSAIIQVLPAPKVDLLAPVVLLAGNGCWLEARR